jgi:hypothetical protein
MLFAGKSLAKAQPIFERFIKRRPGSRLTIRQRTRVLQELPPVREVLLPSTTNEAVASQQISKIGHCDDFTMHTNREIMLS